MPFDLTVGGSTVVYTPGLYGQALASTYRAYTTANVLPSNNTFTVQAVVQTSATALAVAVGSGKDFWFGQAAGGNARAFVGETDVLVDSTVNIANGAPRYVRLTVAPSGLYLYVDGALAGQVLGTPPTILHTNGSEFTIGALNSVGNFAWGGWVDDVAIFNDAKIGDYSPGPVAANDPTLVALWRLDGNLLDSKSSDFTAPTLTSPTGAGGAGVCSGTVSTDEGNGALYAVATASGTAPTAAQVRAGQDHTGAAALRSIAGQAVTATGVQNIASGAVTAGTRYLHFMHEDAVGNRSAVVSSASFSVSSGADTTPPTLTSPTATGGAGVCAGAVTTDEANGTLYAVATASATAPTAGQVKAGQDHTGAAALRVVSQAVSATGAQTIASGSVSSGTRYLHFMHEDTAGNQSAVASSAGTTVTPGDVTAPTLTSPTGTGGAGVCSGTVTTGEANGTLYTVATASATAPTTSQVRAGQDHTGAAALRAVSQAVSATGVQSIASGVVSAGTRYLHFMHEDAAGNRSSVVSSGSFSVAAGSLYTQVNATDPIHGRSIMLLVPSSGSANPYNPANPTKAIIYVHGAGETEAALLSDSKKLGCITALLNAGYILAGLSGANWGTQVSTDYFVGLEKYLRDNYNIRAEGVGVWSQSMGGYNGLQLVAQGKVPVVGWLGTYPCVSLSSLFANVSFTNSIITAHGITGSGSGTYANRTRGQDPSLYQGYAFRHVPMRIYASPGDTVVPKAQNSDVLLAAVTGCTREAVLVACTGDHGDTSHFIPSEYLDFFERCYTVPVTQGRPPNTRTVTVTLTSDGAAPRANLTGIKWAFYDQATPDQHEWPADKGAAGTTNASGVMTLSVRTKLAVGAIGRLDVTNSDGSLTQTPVRLAASGPVQVA